MDDFLHVELEKQLQFAESRCGTLKQQLDYIKQLYKYGKCSNSNIFVQPSFDNGRGDNGDYIKYKEHTKWDNKNICVKTNASQSNTTCTNSRNNQADSNVMSKGYQKHKNQIKFLKVKKKNMKKMKRKKKMDDTSSSKFSNVSSQRHSQIWQDPVVEIYKNSALNAESESGLEIIFNKKIMKGDEVLLGLKKIKCLNKNSESSREKILLEDTKVKKCNSHDSKKCKLFKDEEIQTDMFDDVTHQQRDVTVVNDSNDVNENDVKNVTGKENLIRIENSLFEPVKSYCQPTISSKRKQVGRDVYSNINNINVRNIPFIAAKSTTPSHNIGVNIQQVLSIIKKRHVNIDNAALTYENGINDVRLPGVVNSKRNTTTTNNNNINNNDIEPISEMSTTMTGSSESKKQSLGPSRSSMSHWKSVNDFTKEKQINNNDKDKNMDDNNNNNNNICEQEWTFKVDKLKKVLVFLHEDFTSLSQNISKADAKGELADIEKELEKKEEEITVVISLYKEVLNVRDDFKKLQDKYNLLTYGKPLFLDGLKQTNSAHTQMTTLLRKIQSFQERLKG
ncbi:asparagine-rich protein, putative [Pediculus humanus corporis]|uniref:Asparagine-rich protein, putative n=1 Tax=Pediculus humanus subsp. corporis TaxID=121224 RepID=E0VPL4_PEDHC|nr:asparagine-rich protein, putative [Pediculus humanus corporis]EEB15320.1 asparagine-rich protein, putative [Pediculus humanus corporis]